MTVEEFNKFINDNNISSRKELQDNYTYKYKLFCKFSEAEKNYLLPIQKHGRYGELNTLKDFQNFIDSHHVKSNEDFYTNYAGLYNKCRSILTEEERRSLKFEKTLVNSWSGFNSLQDFQDFIDLNNIESNKEFVRDYPGLYYRYRKLFSKEFRWLKFPEIINDPPFSKLDDFQKYIDENNIKTYKDFRKLHTNIYNKYLKERPNWDNTSLNFPEESNRVSYTELKTNEDFQKYIDDNKINSKMEFRNMKSLSSRFYKVVPKEKRNLVFKEELRHYYKDQFSTLNDFQEFVETNKIFRPVDFRTDFPKIYDRFLRVIPPDERKRLKYQIDSNNEIHQKSYGERYLIKLLENNGIDYIPEKTFSELRGNKSLLRYDLYLPDYNILLEYHGEQHFNENTLYSSEKLIKYDREKFEFANKSGIPILYFTLHKSSLKKFGYFTEVITDADILIQKIKEIGLTTQSNS